jgi:hypothetical protein
MKLSDFPEVSGFPCCLLSLLSIDSPQGNQFPQKPVSLVSPPLLPLGSLLLELGRRFAFVGSQVPLEVDGQTFYLDLLFYHVRLHCNFRDRTQRLDRWPPIAPVDGPSTKLEPMLLTVSTTHQPATDLGYLLHKNPARLQTEDLSFGKAYVFYPEATAERCMAASLSR